MIEVKEVPTFERLSSIRSIVKYDAELSKGGKLAVMALAANPSKKVIAVYDDGIFKGAMSFSVGKKIKRINTGTLENHKGYGRTLVDYLNNNYPDKIQWCLSIAPKWCERLGMKLIGKTKDGRFHFEGFNK